jgi:hypothetical protein
MNFCPKKHEAAAMSNGKILDKYNNLLSFSVPLAIAIVVAAALVARTIETVKQPKRTVEVKGYAEKEIVSDMAVWKSQISATAPTLEAAYSKLEKDEAAVIAYLQKNEISPKQLKINAISTSEKYVKTPKGINTNKIESYILSRNIKVESQNVKLIAELSGKSSELIKSGIMFTSYSPEYFYTKLDSLKIDILGKATLNAKKRADQLTQNSGSATGNLIWARQGVFQVTPRYSTDVSNYGMHDTSSIEKTVKCVVTIEYFIKDKPEKKEKL